MSGVRRRGGSRRAECRQLQTAVEGHRWSTHAAAFFLVYSCFPPTSASTQRSPDCASAPEGRGTAFSAGRQAGTGGQPNREGRLKGQAGRQAGRQARRQEQCRQATRKQPAAAPAAVGLGGSTAPPTASTHQHLRPQQHPREQRPTAALSSASTQQRPNPAPTPPTPPAPSSGARRQHPPASEGPSAYRAWCWPQCPRPAPRQLAPRRP